MTPRLRVLPSLKLLVVLAVTAVTAVAGMAGCKADDTAIARGDRLWADSNYAEALAEYRVGYQRKNGSNELLARVAHAYAVTGDLPHAREYYGDLVKRAPSYADQAVFDFLRLARKAQARSDRYGLAGAIEAAVTLRPGLPVNDLSSGLARYYAGTGDAAKSLEYYERALSTASGDSMASLLFELATVHETRGNCVDAITMFNAFRAKTTDGGKADEARWHIGSCSWDLAQKAEAAGDTAGALRAIQSVLDLGVPENIMDRVWYERGEILLAQGRRDEALASYQKSIEANKAGTGQLTQKAQHRIDEIRFGRAPNQTTTDRVQPPDLF